MSKAKPEHREAAIGWIWSEEIFIAAFRADV
jgi:hypothetical protein